MLFLSSSGSFVPRELKAISSYLELMGLRLMSAATRGYEIVIMISAIGVQEPSH